MSNRIIGKCSQCGGIVSVPTSHMSVIPPAPSCESCHGTPDNLPTVKIKSPKRLRPKLDDLLSRVTEENQHESFFGTPVGKEII